MRDLHVISIGLWIHRELKLSQFGFSGTHLYCCCDRIFRFHSSKGNIYLPFIKRADTESLRLVWWGDSSLFESSCHFRIQNIDRSGNPIQNGNQHHLFLDTDPCWETTRPLCVDMLWVFPVGNDTTQSALGLSALIHHAVFFRRDSPFLFLVQKTPFCCWAKINEKSCSSQQKLATWIFFGNLKIGTCGFLTIEMVWGISQADNHRILSK